MSAQNCSNPERSMAPGGSTISDLDRSIGLFAKVVNIISLCCHVVLHHLFNILEFSLTPASLNSPAALIKMQVTRSNTALQPDAMMTLL